MQSNIKNVLVELARRNKQGVVAASQVVSKLNTSPTAENAIIKILQPDASKS